MYLNRKIKYNKRECKAIERSIKHWKEDYKKLSLFGGSESFTLVFSEAKCDCCREFVKVNPFYSSCKRCPLVDFREYYIKGDEGGIIAEGCCSLQSSPWRCAKAAVYSESKKKFMQARRRIIRVLTDALERSK